MAIKKTNKFRTEEYTMPNLPTAEVLPPVSTVSPSFARTLSFATNQRPGVPIRNEDARLAMSRAPMQALVPSQTQQPIATTTGTHNITYNQPQEPVATTTGTHNVVYNQPQQPAETRTGYQNIRYPTAMVYGGSPNYGGLTAQQIMQMRSGATGGYGQPNYQNPNYPTLNVGSTVPYNPVSWTPTPGYGNGFINSSGGFAYDMLPGMFNYLSDYYGSNMNQASGRANALTDFMGQNITGGYPGGMSQYIQEMVNMLGGPQAGYGQGQQQGAASLVNALGSGQTPQTPIQSQTTNLIGQLMSGSGLSPEYVQAMRESVLQPSQEALVGQLNRMGMGVVNPGSGLQQELLRRNEADFNNQLIRTGYENLNNLLTQGMAAGGQTFGQGLNLAQLQAGMGNQAMQNAFQAMAQGGNLLNQYLGAGLGLQGNQQQYALGLGNQYGNLTSDYLRSYMADQAIKAQLEASRNQAIGSGVGDLLKALYEWYKNRNKQQPNTPNTPGAGVPVPSPSPTNKPPKTPPGTIPNYPIPDLGANPPTTLDVPPIDTTPIEGIPQTPDINFDIPPIGEEVSVAMPNPPDWWTEEMMNEVGGPVPQVVWDVLGQNPEFTQWLSENGLWFNDPSQTPPSVMFGDQSVPESPIYYSDPTTGQLVDLGGQPVQDYDWLWNALWSPYFDTNTPLNVDQAWLQSQPWYNPYAGGLAGPSPYDYGNVPSIGNIEMPYSGTPEYTPTYGGETGFTPDYTADLGLETVYDWLYGQPEFDVNW